MQLPKNVTCADTSVQFLLFFNSQDNFNINLKFRMLKVGLSYLFTAFLQSDLSIQDYLEISCFPAFVILLLFIVLLLFYYCLLLFITVLFLTLNDFLSLSEFIGFFKV